MISRRMLVPHLCWCAQSVLWKPGMCGLWGAPPLTADSHARMRSRRASTAVLLLEGGMPKDDMYSKENEMTTGMLTWSFASGAEHSSNNLLERPLFLL
jgi:hypothetical protein